jgi:uncharacterized protein (DUF983 family)
VNRDLALEGVRCGDCEELAAGAHGKCPKCGSGSVFEVSLVNEITELLARTGADIDFVDPIEGLAEVGGIAALLRY